MEVLYAFHDTMLRQAKDGFYRFLYGKVNWVAAAHCHQRAAWCRKNHHDASAPALWLEAKGVGGFVSDGGPLLVLQPQPCRNGGRFREAWRQMAVY